MFSWQGLTQKVEIYSCLIYVLNGQDSCRQSVRLIVAEQAMNVNTDAEIRRKNLNKICATFETQQELANVIGTTVGYLNHLLGGYRSIGEKAARKIETSLGLDKYSLDINVGAIESPIIVASNVAPEELWVLNLLRDLTEAQRKLVIEYAKKNIKVYWLDKDKW